VIGADEIVAFVAKQPAMVINRNPRATANGTYQSCTSFDSETMYGQRKSNGERVPVPSHPPADYSQAKFFQPGAASG
jgi:hypothetical protein